MAASSCCRAVHRTLRSATASCCCASRRRFSAAGSHFPCGWAPTAAALPPVVLRAAGERYHRGSAYFAAHLLVRAATGISVDADPDDAGGQLTQWVLRRAPQLEEWLPLLAVAARAQVPTTPSVERLPEEF